jgi:hypothetical protein
VSEVLEAPAHHAQASHAAHMCLAHAPRPSVTLSKLRVACACSRDKGLRPGGLEAWRPGGLEAPRAQGYPGPEMRERRVALQARGCRERQPAQPKARGMDSSTAMKDCPVCGILAAPPSAPPGAAAFGGELCWRAEAVRLYRALIHFPGARAPMTRSRCGS